MNIMHVEKHLSSAINSPSKNAREFLVKFQRAIDNLKTGEHDFVLIDNAPNASSVLTALLVLTGDYWIAPVVPSFDSVQAIDNLLDIIRNWKDEGEDTFGLKGFTETPNTLGLKLDSVFLGIIVQKSKRYRESSGGAKMWITDLNQRLQPFLANAPTKCLSINNFNLLFPNLKNHSERSPHIIYSCCDFTANLQSVSDRSGFPVVSLNKKICSNTKIVTGYKANGSPKVGYVNIDPRGIQNAENQYYLSHMKTKEAYNQIADDLIN